MLAQCAATKRENLWMDDVPGSLYRYLLCDDDGYIRLSDADKDDIAQRVAKLLKVGGYETD